MIQIHTLTCFAIIVVITVYVVNKNVKNINAVERLQLRSLETRLQITNWHLDYNSNGWHEQKFLFLNINQVSFYRAVGQNLINLFCRFHSDILYHQNDHSAKPLHPPPPRLPLPNTGVATQLNSKLNSKTHTYIYVCM